MALPPNTDDLFFAQTGMDQTRVQRIIDDTLAKCDDGELFLEYAQSESLAFDDGRLKNASFDTTQGFGLRAVVGESTGFAHASNLSEEAIVRAAINGISAIIAPNGRVLARWSEVNSKA